MKEKSKVHIVLYINLSRILLYKPTLCQVREETGKGNFCQNFLKIVFQGMRVYNKSPNAFLTVAGDEKYAKKLQK